MMLRPLLAGFLLTITAACLSAQKSAQQPAEEPAEKTAGQAIPRIGPVGEIEKIKGDFQWTEGPTWAPGGTLYFTDLRADRIYRLATDDLKVEVFVEPSLHCNGLMYAGGQLYACSEDEGLLAYDNEGNWRYLRQRYKNNDFNGLNDLVVDKTGGVYFSDPRYQAPLPWPQGVEAVYYWTPATPDEPRGTVTRLIGDLNHKAPNGVILSPDEKTLYVVCTLQDEIMQYPILSPGKIGKGEVFAKIKQPEGVTESGGDGVAIDGRGNLYVCTQLGVQVFSPKGEYLGVIPLPEEPSNAVFCGPDMKTLCVTAHTSVYVVPMAVAGHQFPGPQRTRSQAASKSQ